MSAKRKCHGECGLNRQTASFSSKNATVCNVCKKKTSRATARRRHLKMTYGITPEEYDAILARQGGVCAICKGSRSYNLAVDHDHAIAAEFSLRESIRGLLCKRCNKLLRDVRDSVEVLRAAADYTINPPAKKVLFP
jgi:hypothetical protein